jgi:hypothetical protein
VVGKAVYLGGIANQLPATIQQAEMAVDQRVPDVFLRSQYELLTRVANMYHCDITQHIAL